MMEMEPKSRRKKETEATQKKTEVSEIINEDKLVEEEEEGLKGRADDRIETQKRLKKRKALSEEREEKAEKRKDIKETRRIQRTLSGSFFVTLNKGWIDKHHLEKQKEVILTEDENENLVIKPFSSQRNFEVEFILPIEEYLEENSLERCINSSYIQGSDIITITSNNIIALDRKRVVKDCVSYLIGTEISEDLSNKITIRILVDPVKFPLVSLIDRIYKLVNSMHMDAIKAFQESDQMLAEDVISREREVDKLFYLMLRQLNLSLTNRLNFADICRSDMKIDCVLGIVLARDLSKMAHYAVEIAKEVLKLINKEIGKDLKDHILKMSIFTRKMQANAILAFFKNDFMRANAVLNEIQKVVEFDHQTENAVFQQINDIGLIISLISISRDIRNIANSAVAVAQDLQAKYRPKDTYLREKTPEATDYLISMDDELKT